MFSGIISYFKQKTEEIEETEQKSGAYRYKNKCKKPKYKKKKIPKALREQVWINKMGKVFSGTCCISWCENHMSCFNFDCGHNIPESKGGPTNIENLIPICRNCNIGMGNRYTIDEWEKKYATPYKWYHMNYWYKKI